MIIRWPGRIVQGEYERRASLVSIAPTILEAAGPAGRTEMIVSQWYGRQALYDDRFKSIFYSYGLAEFYDLAKDPAENVNLADLYPDRVAAFREALDKWESSRGAAKKEIIVDESDDIRAGSKGTRG